MPPDPTARTPRTDWRTRLHAATGLTEHPTPEEWLVALYAQNDQDRTIIRDLVAEAARLDIATLRRAIYAISVRHDWANTIDRVDRTAEIAAEYARLSPVPVPPETDR